MDKLVIQGPVRLQGEIDAGRSKNCALPVLFASLLSDAKDHRIAKVPRLADMESTLKMLVHLGAQIEQKYCSQFGCDWLIDSSHVSNMEAPYDLVRKMRASILCLGPLLAKNGQARVSLPGGCAIGARPIDLHLFALEKLGASVEQEAGYVELTVAGSRLQGAKIDFPLVSVGATENAMMAACLAQGETQIHNAACEPEIVGLGEALLSMGAQIKGLGTPCLEIVGVQKLGAMNFEIPPDRIETATYLIAAQMTGGDVFIRDAKKEDLEFVLECLKKTGAELGFDRDGIRCVASSKITPLSIKTDVFPGFPTDLQAQWMALMTQAEGDSYVDEEIFENRFMHVPELQRMGADLKIDGSRVEVHGARASLTGAPVMATDLRASASLVLAALVAKGESEIKRIYHLDRGYESMEIKLRQLGVDVERTVDS